MLGNLGISEGFGHDVRADTVYFLLLGIAQARLVGRALIQNQKGKEKNSQ